MNKTLLRASVAVVVLGGAAAVAWSLGFNRALISFPSAVAQEAAPAAQEAAPAAAPAEGEAAAAENPVVARVNGAEIRRSDVIALVGRLPQQYRQLPIEILGPMLIEQLVSDRLLADAARGANLEQDPQVQERLEALKQQILAETYLNREVEARVTDEKIQQAYDAYVAANPPQPQVRARHILVETEEEAKQIIEQLKGGADFAQLARERSKDTGAQDGDLGWFTKDVMVPEFAEAAFAMEAGTISETPVKTQFGWHVIKVEEKGTTAPPTLEEVRGELFNQVARQEVDALVAELRGKAEIELFQIDGTPLPAETAVPGATEQAPAEQAPKN